MTFINHIIHCFGKNVNMTDCIIIREKIPREHSCEVREGERRIIQKIGNYLSDCETVVSVFDLSDERLKGSHEKSSLSVSMNLGSLFSIWTLRPE